MYTVFLVDDEPMVLNKLKKMPGFLECGFTICGTATTPQEAVTKICEQKPDAVFTDLKMPGLSGTELCSKLKSLGIPCETVIISAYGEFQEARQFFTTGGFDYMLKPITDHDLTTLLTELGKRLEKKKRENMVLKSLSPELNLIVKYLEDNLTEKHTLESLSQRFAVNTNHICNLFSQHLNTTFTAHMTALRMKEALRLLRETAKSVKEISYACGYSDYFYFCRVFREQHNCTPSAYREEQR